MSALQLRLKSLEQEEFESYGEADDIIATIIGQAFEDFELELCVRRNIARYTIYVRGEPKLKFAFEVGYSEEGNYKLKLIEYEER